MHAHRFAQALPAHWGTRSTRQLRVCVVMLAVLTCSVAQAQSTQLPVSNANTSAADTAVNGPTRLRQTPADVVQPSTAARPPVAAPGRDNARPGAGGFEPALAPPSEFEEYVNRLAFPQGNFGNAGNAVGTGGAGGAGGTGFTSVPRIQRLGAELMTDSSRQGDAVDFSPLVPPDYLVSPGDEIVLSIWGSVDAELRLVVDRSGRITIPRVGAIMVSGVRYGDLPATISQRVGQTFKNFQLSVSLGQLRGVRVYVTGFVGRPGAYTVSALSSMASALVRAGGPSASGSFRHIELRRGSGLVSTLDFYDLLLKGNRSSDKLVQADDVIHVGPIGSQVGMIGSVNRAAIFELKPNETMADALRMAGGFAAVADTTRLSLERIDDRATLRVTQVEATQLDSAALRNGDVLRAFNAVTVATSLQSQNKRVRIEGEVLRPGDYVLPARSTIADAVQAAGGLTQGAFVFGTDFSRESVRITQQENYERALRNLETEISLASTTQRVTNADEAAALSGRTAATTKLIERLRAIRPTGRVVLQMPPDSRELPNLVLEDGDRLLVPAAPTSIGVFGSVFNSGNYLLVDGRNLSEYLNQAGGPTRGADASSTFVLRANGSVVSNLQEKTWLNRGLQGSFESIPALPGDTLFVPEELDKTTFVQHAKDWTQILAQFALGVAAFVTLTD